LFTGACSCAGFSFKVVGSSSFARILLSPVDVSDRSGVVGGAGAASCAACGGGVCVCTPDELPAARAAQRAALPPAGCWGRVSAGAGAACEACSAARAAHLEALEVPAARAFPADALEAREEDALATAFRWAR
jgi:hypothetical protein